MSQPDGQEGAPARARQFSIRQIMIWIAGVAAFLALIRHDPLLRPVLWVSCAFLVYRFTGIRAAVRLVYAQPRRGGAAAGGPPSSLVSVSRRRAPS
jgi:hypothetical protein